MKSLHNWNKLKEKIYIHKKSNTHREVKVAQALFQQKVGILGQNRSLQTRLDESRKRKKSSLSGENNRCNQGCKQGLQLVQSTSFSYRCRLQNSVKKIMAKKPKLTIVATSHERCSIETKILKKNIEAKSQIWKSLNVVTVLYPRILKVFILLIIVKEKRKNYIAE